MVIASPLFPSSTPVAPSSGGRLVATGDRALPLRGVELQADAGGGIARTVLRQTFENVHPETLHVTYKVPLPADGAVSGFTFRIGDELVVGEVDAKKRARERFEQALAEGKTAALLDQERSSLFTQQVGNIAPQTTVICEIVVDQPLVWVEGGAWEWRFPTVVGPRYTGGQTPDADRVAVDVADRHLAVRADLSLRVDDGPARVESPSHAVELLDDGRVRFANDVGMRLDRDVVVRWPVAEPKVGLTVRTARTANDGEEDAYGLLTVVPPRPDAAAPAVARDLTFLIDTSGSMGGRPLQDASAIVAAMIDTLTDQDRVEIVAFAWAPKRWCPAPVSATTKNKRAAIEWVRALQAGGGTEMESGIQEALSPLRAESTRQVVLVTDGFIGFEERIIRRILQTLPPSCRLHTVGVGSAVNRTLLKGAARAGAGVEVVVGLGEDPERAAQRLLARTTRPIVTELRVMGAAVAQAVPRSLPNLYQGAPALVSVRLDAQGGEVLVQGRTAFGPWAERVVIPPVAAAEGSDGVRRLFAREWVQDLETERAAGAASADIDAQVERVGLEYQISTRLTSWVAVSAHRTVDPDAEARRETMPHELAHGLSAEGLGLRAATASAPVTLRQQTQALAARPQALQVGGSRDEEMALGVEWPKRSIAVGAEAPSATSADEEAFDLLDDAGGYIVPGAPAPVSKRSAPSWLGWTLVIGGVVGVVGIVALLLWLLLG